MQTIPFLCAAPLLAFASCASPLAISNDDALSTVKLEVQVDHRGNMVEIEYHINPAAVPAAVKSAMDALHPGDPFTDAEREYQGGQVYYELNRMVDGREVEAMFLPDGTLHSEEVEVLADRVPAVVLDTLRTVYPTCSVTKYEEIRDGNRVLVEYHIKVEVEGLAYKVLLSPAGEHLGAFREIVSEIEVPID